MTVLAATQVYRMLSKPGGMEFPNSFLPVAMPNDVLWRNLEAKTTLLHLGTLSCIWVLYLSRVSRITGQGFEKVKG